MANVDSVNVRLDYKKSPPGFALSSLRSHFLGSATESANKMFSDIDAATKNFQLARLRLNIHKFLWVLIIVLALLTVLLGIFAFMGVMKMIDHITNLIIVLGLNTALICITLMISVVVKIKTLRSFEELIPPIVEHYNENYFLPNGFKAHYRHARFKTGTLGGDPYLIWGDGITIRRSYFTRTYSLIWMEFTKADMQPQNIHLLIPEDGLLLWENNNSYEWNDRISPCM